MDTWLIENTLVELSTGPLLQLFRSKVGVIYQSTSRDMGMTVRPPSVITVAGARAGASTDRAG